MTFIVFFYSCNFLTEHNWDKSIIIPALPGQTPEMVFQRCQRTDAAGEFNQNCPENHRNVEPWHPPYVKNAQPAEHHKQDKRKVHYQKQINHNKSFP